MSNATTTEFSRELARVDIPTLEIVPEDPAEKAAWERKRKRIEDARKARNEKAAELRMEAFRRYDKAQKNPIRRALRAVERFVVELRRQ